MRRGRLAIMLDVLGAGVMRNGRFGQREESFERWRERMLDETSRFIEWGLQHQEEVEWIPRHPVGRGQFSERLRHAFWGLILENTHWPE